MSDSERLEPDDVPAKQQRAIDALLRNPTTRAAARAAGVSEPTIFRWMNEPAFAKAYREARGRILESTLSALQSASSDAVKTLKRVMANNLARPGERVSAARTVLEFALKASEKLEVEERLRVLEARLDQSLKGNVR